jgi:hypothetical protein
MDHAIQWVAGALSANFSLNQIHDHLKASGMFEHNIYLVIKAGEILFKARLDLYGEVL